MLLWSSFSLWLQLQCPYGSGLESSNDWLAGTTASSFSPWLSQSPRPSCYVRVSRAQSAASNPFTPYRVADLNFNSARMGLGEILLDPRRIPPSALLQIRLGMQRLIHNRHFLRQSGYPLPISVPSTSLLTTQAPWPANSLPTSSLPPPSGAPHTTSSPSSPTPPSPKTGKSICLTSDLAGAAKTPTNSFPRDPFTPP